MTNNWQKIDSEQVYDNPWITVEHHNVITPNKTRGIYGKVHFKNLAIGIIPLDEQQNTWIVGQHRYTLDQYSWEIPMGGGPLDEDPLISAQRELQEETGLTADTWQHLLDIHTSNSVTDEYGSIYIAQQLTMGETAFDPTEDLRIKKLPFAELVTMVLDGAITDSLTIAGVLKLNHLIITNQMPKISLSL
jgi:8-oxo-dGTP pyrophosphatase MutT (NUDIX family)